MTSIVGVEKYRIMVGVRGGAALGPIPSGLGVDEYTQKSFEGRDN